MPDLAYFPQNQFFQMSPRERLQALQMKQRGQYSPEEETLLHLLSQRPDLHSYQGPAAPSTQGAPQAQYQPPDAQQGFFESLFSSLLGRHPQEMNPFDQVSDTLESQLLAAEGLKKNNRRRGDSRMRAY